MNIATLQLLVALVLIAGAVAVAVRSARRAREERRRRAHDAYRARIIGNWERRHHRRP